MTIATLFARIGMKDEASAKLATFGKNVNEVGSQFKFLLGAAVAFGAAVTGIMRYSLNLSVGMKQFSAETGASAEELQRWQAVAGQTNVSTEALTDSVKELASNREKIKLGQGNIKAFQLLGIDPLQDPFKILEDLKTKTAGLPQAMKRNLLQEMGVSSQLLQILELSNDEFARMKANAFVIPQSTIDALARTNASMTLAGNAVKWLTSLIAEKLAPGVEKLTKAFVNWIKVNKDGIVAGIQRVFNVLMSLFNLIMKVSQIIGDVISHTIGWNNALLLLLGVWIALNSAMFASPITWIIAGIILLIAVMDDLYRYTHGQKSAFGTFANASKPLKAVIDALAGAFTALGAAFDAIFKGDSSGLDKLIQKWGVFGNVIAVVSDAIKYNFLLWKELIDVATGKFNFDVFLKEQKDALEQLGTHSGLSGLISDAIKGANSGNSKPTVNLTVSQTGRTQDELKVDMDRARIYADPRATYANRVNH